MSYSSVEQWHQKKELTRITHLTSPPKQLYFRGTWNEQLFEDCTAIVGSRHMTAFGKKVIEKIVPTLINNGKTIISGFMRGVDNYAHEVCAQGGGKTIAVLGWGIAEPLGPDDAIRIEKITASGGLILSQWEYQQATRWTFPVRNKIVAALAHDVIVIEAALKSGSLITASLARKLHRRLWAVPGPTASPTSQGTNALISDGLATPWTESATFPTELPLLAYLKDTS